ncbi:thermonuclease family protein [Bacillus aquiflavi]|uniref:thermonuclease family protein n=1 Tax=Bacillus aquiflavi TaxID=2672567 RepID=UPI001CA7EE33|nr:thermonuclease family protein [Bacillus aquiflavi]UAC49168.1 thermonuclease family protein [Bacillus aquiflavi]
MRKLIFFLLLSISAIIFSGCGEINETSDKNITETTNTEVQEVETDQAAESHSFMKATVINVVDGDTIDVRFEDGKKERVRLILVDTPETKHPKKPVQPFGPEASDFTKDTLLHQDIKLELDVEERDRYGRILAYVYVNEKMINEMLLEKGLARVAVFPPNTKYVDQFRAIQEKAQKEERGIWSLENYVTDKGYETDHSEQQNSPSTQTSNSCQSPTIKGNINSKGEKIYHVPSGDFYDRTIAEEMFCSEDEAVQAGYRKSQR